MHTTPTPTALVPCPVCVLGNGRPQTVQLSADRRIQTYTCDRCDHEWSVTSDYRNPLFQWGR